MRQPKLWAVAAVALTFSSRGAHAEVPAGTDPSPTTVTLHMHDAKLADVVDELAKQSGLKLVTGDGSGLFGGWGRVTVDADAKPAWQVVSDLADQAKAMPSNQPDGSLLLIPTEPSMAGRRVVGGPVLATFRQVEHLSQLTAPAPHVDFCEVTADLLWEPRLRVAYTLSSDRPAEAVDEHGLSLVPTDAAAAAYDPRQPNNYRAFGPYESTTRNRGWDANGTRYSIRLSVPPAAGRKLATLKGQVRVWVAGPDEQAEIPDLATVAKASGKKSTKTYPLGKLARIRVNSMRIDSDSVQGQLAIARGGASEDAWEQSRLLMSSFRMRVLTADGKEWGTLNGESGSNVQQDSVMIYPYIQSNGSNAGKPDKLVIEGTRHRHRGGRAVRPQGPPAAVSVAPSASRRWPGTTATNRTTAPAAMSRMASLGPRPFTSFCTIGERVGSVISSWPAIMPAAVSVTTTCTIPSPDEIPTSSDVSTAPHTS